MFAAPRAYRQVGDAGLKKPPNASIRLLMVAEEKPVGCTNSNCLTRPAHTRAPARQADRVAPHADCPGGLDRHSLTDRSAA